MRNSHYTYKIEPFFGRLTLLIIQDHYNGGISVTNDIENVVDKIVKTEKIKGKYITVYRDTEGNWDGWHNNQFIILSAKSLGEAKKKLQKEVPECN